MSIAAPVRLSLPNLLHDSFLSERQVSNAMAVQVFFDESGKLANTSHVAFAGCVAPAATWITVDRKWTPILEKHGVNKISMKEAVNFRGPFRGWEGRSRERDRLLTDLVSVATPLIEMFSACSISQQQFATLSSRLKKSLKNPWYCGFEGCVRQVVERTNPSEAIQICCDSTEEFAIECISLYHRLRRTNNEFKRRCGNITFGEDQRFYGLQLADIFAYCVREYDKTKGDPTPLVRDLLSIIEPNGHGDDYFHYHPAASLGEGALRLGAVQ